MKPEEADGSDSATAVSVQVTAPDGKPGLVREDDKAPTFIAPLHDKEVALTAAIVIPSSVYQCVCTLVSVFKQVPLGNAAGLTVKVKDADEVYFTRDGEVLEDSEKYAVTVKDNAHTLEIVDAGPDDEGEYTVICENKYGHVSSTANLLITGQQRAEHCYSYQTFSLSLYHCNVFVM